MGPSRELLRDPVVVLAAHVAVIEIGLRGIDAHDREPRGAQALGTIPVEALAVAGEALAEQPLEVNVADVTGIMVARDHEHRWLEAREPAGCLLEFPVVTSGGEGSGDHDDVGLHTVDFLHYRLHGLGVEGQLSAVDIAYLRDAD